MADGRRTKADGERAEPQDVAMPVVRACIIGSDMLDNTSRTRRPFVLAEAVTLLANTPRTLDALLRTLSDDWLAAHEGGETWSPPTSSAT